MLPVHPRILHHELQDIEYSLPLHHQVLTAQKPEGSQHEL